ncbi:ATP-dependent protease [Alteromonas sediminis]|uniref:ATP-dependent protease n=1 Tax=Alteromonas sediminis TaxID=2259342 RepID=A0A3N5ZAL0_9ALTE|nr:YifB family Mg chelatase-like AAA ATPase [Alteromonas sediminis]RPJ66528.1 ATP-dependent protease [Alteromonas sediminis]
MGLAVIRTRAIVGLDSPPVNVEVHLANGIPGFHIVGMAETTVKEAKDRVRGALINSGFELPAKRITVNLAPADLPKQGGRFDLPIALGILCASEQIPASACENIEVFGELALSGDVRAIAGALPFAVACQKQGTPLILPKDNVPQVSLVNGLKCLPVASLLDAFTHLSGSHLHFTHCKKACHAPSPPEPYWCDIVGQEHAKRGLMIAAAGNHHLLFVGPPGTGKSLLASRLLDLLPPLSVEQALEVASIRSVAGQSLDEKTWAQRPFRRPHHTASSIALTGGGSPPKPGEVSLAHHGVLFMDELPEFGRHTLDVLREPLESGDINIARANAQARYPARFQLVAAMNPSPTGDILDGRSSPDQILRYLNRLSGPLLDRIDLQIEVPKLDDFGFGRLRPPSSLTAQEAYNQCELAREKQRLRQGCLNAQLPIDKLEEACALTTADVQYFQDVALQLELSLRVFHRCLRIARTIADMANCDAVGRNHFAEAMSYRALDKLIREFSSHVK